MNVFRGIVTSLLIMLFIGSCVTTTIGITGGGNDALVASSIGTALGSAWMIVKIQRGRG